MKLKQLFFTILGVLLVAVGIAGLFLPVLPSVPFWLLALVLFSKGIPPFERWFSKTKFYKRFFSRVIDGKGFTIPAKIIITAVVWAMMAIMFFSVDSIWIKILSVVLAMGHTIGFGIMSKTDKGD